MAPRRNKRAATRIQHLLRQWMEKNSLSRVQAADRLGVSLKTVDRWIRGESAPWDNQIEKIAPVMGFRSEEFYEEPTPVDTSVISRLDKMESRLSVVEDRNKAWASLALRVNDLARLFADVQGDGTAAREEKKDEAFGDVEDVGGAAKRRQTKKRGRGEDGRASGQ